MSSQYLLFRPFFVKVTFRGLIRYRTSRRLAAEVTAVRLVL